MQNHQGSEGRRIQVRAALAIVGAQPFTRDQLVLRVFNYVRRHGLIGDEKTIRAECDANLRALFRADERVVFGDLVRKVGEMLPSQVVGGDERERPTC